MRLFKCQPLEGARRRNPITQRTSIAVFADKKGITQTQIGPNHHEDAAAAAAAAVPLYRIRHQIFTAVLSSNRSLVI